MIIGAYFRLMRAGYVLAREGALSIPGKLPPALAPLRVGIWLGRLVEYGRTDRIFTAPAEKLTEDYVTGRCG